MSGTKEDLEKLTCQLRQQVDEMKKSLKELEMSRYMRPSVEELIKANHKWEPWYAWRPVQDIHGQWHCFKEIYRLPGNTYVDHDDWRWYYYGTILDVLENSK
jgi:hypothetical protein